jgi:hypothetical protein
VSSSIMKGSKSHELEADVPASELWKIYGTLRFVELLHERLPQVLHKVEVVRGDGTVGTVIQVTFPPGEERDRDDTHHPPHVFI